MKISKQRLAEIVKEEIEASDGSISQISRTSPIVERVKDLLPQIDTQLEYEQLLLEVMNHQIDNKEAIIRKVFGASIGDAVIKSLSSK